jgi:ParB-like chromosome segregation protein Spo0J
MATKGTLNMNLPVIVETIERVPVTKLVPDIRNPRTHSETQIQQLMDSIRKHGFVNPILAGTDYVVIAGNCRLEAAKRLPLEFVPAIVLAHLSATQRRALAIADNQLALNAGWDEDVLRAELAALQEADFDTASLGFADEDLARLMAAQDLPHGLGDEEAIPELAETPVSIRGDLWLLGPHRLLCGDATVQADRDRLMAGQMADLGVTDPPYNVAYEGYTADRLTIQGDRMDAQQFVGFMEGAFDGYGAILKPDASLYVFHASSWQREVQSALEHSGFAVRCQLIWAKSHFGWGFGRYKFQHEPLFYCHRAGQQDRWYGDKSQSTLWEGDKPAAIRSQRQAGWIALGDPYDDGGYSGANLERPHKHTGQICLTLRPSVSAQEPSTLADKFCVYPVQSVHALQWGTPRA